MAEPENLTWAATFIAALSGGLVASSVDHLVAWIKAHRKEKKSAKDIVDAHLDPLLKAADEISGKTISLAERDFSPLARQEASGAVQPFNADLVGLAYLYAKFWGRIEILDKESMGVSISSDARGRKLSKFLSCLGSQQIRLTNRTHQKAIGEITTELLPSGGLRTIGLVEFGKKITEDASAKTWCVPLTELLTTSHTKATRQQLLMYGVVLHALVDALDPEHHSTHQRPAYPNKLSKASKQRIEYLVFGNYLEGTGAINLYTADK